MRLTDAVADSDDAGDGMSVTGQHAVVVGTGQVVQAGRDVVVTFQQATRRVAWPVRVGVPPVPADRYQERQALAVLVDALTRGRAGLPVGASRAAGVVVSGLGGVGKSQLAARHAWQLWPDESVDVAVWVSAVSRDAVVTAYAEAATRVLIEQDPRITDRSPGDAAGLFREWLAATSRRWLVVLDDVQDVADVRGLEPPPGPGGQVIVTSRLRDAALSRGAYRVIELDVFTAEEAVDYLTGVLGEHGKAADSGQLRGLAEELGRLPLALGQAAVFIADQPMLGVADYRAMVADRRRTLDELTPPEESLPEHQATVAATWSLSIERADQTGDAGQGVARPLLEVASLLDPHGIPLEVFTSPAVLDHLAAAVGREVARDVVIDGLTRLHRFSLVTLVSARAVSVHALVQRAVRDTVSADRLHALAHATADALQAVWPEIDTTDPDLAQTLRSGTAMVHAHTTPALWTPGLHAVLARVGGSLGHTGQVAAAMTHWRDLQRQAHDHHGPDHPDTLTARHEVARWRGESGDPAGAAAQYEMLLADRLRVLGADHPDTLITRTNLARWRGEIGDLAGAAAQYEALLADHLRVLGPDHPDTLTTRNNLAFMRGEAGDRDGAVAEFEALLADRLRILGPDDPHTLNTRANLAALRGKGGDPARPVAEYEALLTDHLRILGAGHPNTFTIRSNLAHWRGKAGDAASSVSEYEALLTDHLRALGPDHPDTLITRANLARWRGEAGDPARATTEYEALLADRLRILGPDHPQTLLTRANLAYLWGTTGDPARAATEYEALLADYLRIVGHDHPAVSTIRASLSRWQREAGDQMRT